MSQSWHSSFKKGGGEDSTAYRAGAFLIVRLSWRSHYATRCEHPRDGEALVGRIREKSPTGTISPREKNLAGSALACWVPGTSLAMGIDMEMGWEIGFGGVI